MPKRTIYVQSPCRISIKNKSLHIEGDRSGLIPLEDIWVVILESQESIITSSALSSMADAGIGVMLCGEDHMPNGLSLPLGAHSRHATIVKDQLSISKPLQKQLWKEIVVAKISNQAMVLELLGIDSANVKKFSHDVLSGDTNNREGSAASAYFKLLLPKGHRREGPYSGPLDYGYGILRAGVGRSAVAAGWLVSRGIHHHSELNAFNLVDDLIEPFRPLVDLLVVQNNIEGKLTPQSKHTLATVFEHYVIVQNEKLILQAAIDSTLASLRIATLEKDPQALLLPSIIPLETATLE